MSYLSKEELDADCKLEGRNAIFYQKPGSKHIAHALAAEIGGVEISQAYSAQTFEKNKAVRPIYISWWSFVEIFSRVFAEKAVGDCYLAARVPHEETKKETKKKAKKKTKKKTKEERSIWENVEHPALMQNVNVTSVTCVHYEDFNLRTVIYSRPCAVNPIYNDSGYALLRFNPMESVSSLTLSNSAATSVIKTPLQKLCQRNSQHQVWCATHIPGCKETAAINLAYHYWMILSDLQRIDPSIETGSTQILAYSILDHINIELKPVLSAVIDKIAGSKGRWYLDQMKSLFNSLVEACTSSTENYFTPTEDMISDVTAWELLLLVVIEKEAPESIDKLTSIVKERHNHDGTDGLEAFILLDWVQPLRWLLPNPVI